MRSARRGQCLHALYVIAESHTVAHFVEQVANVAAEEAQADGAAQGDQADDQRVLDHVLAIFFANELLKVLLHGEKSFPV